MAYIQRPVFREQSSFMAGGTRQINFSVRKLKGARFQCNNVVCPFLWGQGF